MQLIALLNDADEGASFSLRPELFRIAQMISADQMICRFYNPGEAPVIDAERDFYAVGIPLFKSFENLRICVPEAVNRLVIVSDDADVAVICGKQVKKLRLQLSPCPETRRSDSSRSGPAIVFSSSLPAKAPGTPS